MTEFEVNENKMVCEALSTVGLNVNSVYDLVNSSNNYPEAMPILVEMLPKVKSDKIKEGVARALTVRKAGKEVVRSLINEFVNYKVSNRREEYAKWAIANAILITSDNSFYEDIEKLIKSKQYETGMVGGMLVKTIAKMKNPLKKEFLLGLLANDELKGYVIMELGRLKYKEALPQIKNYLNCEEEWVRRVAVKAIKKIEGSK